MKDVVFLGTKVSPPIHAALEQRYELIGPYAKPFEESLRGLPAEDAKRIRIMVTLGSTTWPGAALEYLPALEMIACVGSGYEGIDFDYAKKRGIRVTHGPDTNGSSVADIAMGLLIEAVRNMPAGRDKILAGKWVGNAVQPNKPLRGLTGRKIGIYGLGAIGMRIARRAEAFEMEVGYHNRKPRGDVNYAYHASLLELAQWADVLMIAVRAGPENRHAVNREIMEALGPDGYIVNISRGLVIDEAALVKALQEKVFAGAGLDVYEHEPKVPSELFHLPNVAIAPHLGGTTLEAQINMEKLLVSNVEAFFAGRALPSPVPGFA